MSEEIIITDHSSEYEEKQLQYADHSSEYEEEHLEYATILVKKKIFFCSYCSFSFQDRCKLTSHILSTHTFQTTPIYNIEYGTENENFDEIDDLNQGLELLVFVNPEDYYPCELCSNSFESKQVLTYHILMQHTFTNSKKKEKIEPKKELYISSKKTGVVSPDMTSPTTNGDAFVKAVECILPPSAKKSKKAIEQKKKIICKTCGICFKNVRSKRYHISVIHNDQTGRKYRENPYACVSCFLYFDSELMMKLHNDHVHGFDFINKPLRVQLDKPVNKPIIMTIEQALNKPPAATVENALNKPPDATVERTVDKNLNKTLEKPFDKPRSNTLDKGIYKPFLERVKTNQREHYNEITKFNNIDFISEPLTTKHIMHKMQSFTEDKYLNEVVDRNTNDALIHASIDDDLVSPEVYQADDEFDFYEEFHAQRNDSNLHCIECGMGFSEQKKLAKHRNVAHGVPFECEKCGKLCDLEAKFLTHCLNHVRERRYSCRICGRICNRLYNLYKHEETHQKAPTEKQIKSAMLLARKPFSCDLCDKRFMTEKNMRTHQNQHRGDRPHICEQCGKTYVSEWDLKRHQICHTKLFACDKCGKGFQQRAHLEMHMNSHGEEFTLACEHCGVKFSKAHQLRGHEKRYRNDFENKCNVCSKEFSGGCLLAKHQLIDHGIEFQINQKTGYERLDVKSKSIHNAFVKANKASLEARLREVNEDFITAKKSSLDFKSFHFSGDFHESKESTVRSRDVDFDLPRQPISNKKIDMHGADIIATKESSEDSNQSNDKIDSPLQQNMSENDSDMDSPDDSNQTVFDKDSKPDKKSILDTKTTNDDTSYVVKKSALNSELTDTGTDAAYHHIAKPSQEDEHRTSGYTPKVQKTSIDPEVIETSSIFHAVNKSHLKFNNSQRSTVNPLETENGSIDSISTESTETNSDVFASQASPPVATNLDTSSNNSNVDPTNTSGKSSKSKVNLSVKYNYIKVKPFHSDRNSRFTPLNSNINVEHASFRHTPYDWNGPLNQAHLSSFNSSVVQSNILGRPLYMNIRQNNSTMPPLFKPNLLPFKTNTTPLNSHIGLNRPNTSPLNSNTQSINTKVSSINADFESAKKVSLNYKMKNINADFLLAKQSALKSNFSSIDRHDNVLANERMGIQDVEPMSNPFPLSSAHYYPVEMKRLHCPACKSKFLDEPSLRRHMVTHSSMMISPKW